MISDQSQVQMTCVDYGKDGHKTYSSKMRAINIAERRKTDEMQNQTKTTTHPSKMTSMGFESSWKRW